MLKEYDIFLKRYIHGPDSTTGEITDWNDEFLSYSLEDEYRAKKVWGETRIPEGRYEIKLRTEGSFHAKYEKRFGKDYHKGMLHLQNVPNFEYILIHCGNTDDDTAGCILVGIDIFTDKNKNTVISPGASTIGYKMVYEKILPKLLAGNKVFINIS